MKVAKFLILFVLHSAFLSRLFPEDLHSTLGEKFADLSQKYCGTCNRNSMEIKPQMVKTKAEVKASAA